MTDEEYLSMTESRAPRSPLLKDLLLAFVIGGLICCLGQATAQLWEHFGAAHEDAAALSSVSLIFLSAFLTGIGVYDSLAKLGGGGTLVPITGFANAVAAPALEFKTEGYICGTAAKMFVISGPVIVFGILASAVYGVFLSIFGG